MVESVWVLIWVTENLLGAGDHAETLKMTAPRTQQFARYFSAEASTCIKLDMGCASHKASEQFAGTATVTYLLNNLLRVAEGYK